MEASHMFSTVETHTAGEPTRIITEGITFSSGEKTTSEYRQEFKDEYDWVRRLIIKEPRGHDDMFGVVPVPTSNSDADLGLFFITNEDYLDMCGHAMIGVVTAFLELGRLPKQETVTIETPAGLIETKPTANERGVKHVKFQNVESFVVDSCEVSLSTGVTVDADIVYGGNYFAMVDSNELGVPVSQKNIRTLVDLGREVRQKVNERKSIQHPFTGKPVTVELTEFYMHDSEADQNVAVFANNSFDRSPCGTGTCAKLALLYSRGELDVKEPYRHRSIIDTEIEGCILSARTKDARKVITPSIRGSAYITAKNQFFLDPKDPLLGFNVGR